MEKLNLEKVCRYEGNFMTKTSPSSLKMESPKGKETCSHPRFSANPLSIITFAWILPLFKKGFKKELEVEDLYGVLPEQQSDYLGEHMQSLWNKELQLAKLHKREPSLARILFRWFGLKVFGLGFILATSEFIFKLSQPLLLGRLIRYFTEDNEITYEMAFVYAAGMVLCSAGATMVKQPYMLATFHIGMKIRVGLCSLVYRKALRLSKTALGETTVGQAVNLMSNDMNRLDYCAYFLVYTWFGPVQTIFVGYILFQLVGASVLIGITIIGLLVPIQGAFGRLLSSLRMRTAKRTDERIRFMNEIIVGIQVIKMYAWEKSFAHLVDICRRREMKVIKHASFIRGFLLSFEKFSTRIAIFITVVTHVLLKGSVTAEQIFVVTAYFNTLKQTMTDLIPRSIAQISEAYTSLKRIQTFLLYEEVSIHRSVAAVANSTQEDDESETLIDLKQNSIKIMKSAITEGSLQSETLNSNHMAEKLFEETKGIAVNSISAKWTDDLNENTLTDVSMAVKSGQLVAIIGPVGSGKTSLLHAILGELPTLRGTISVKGTMAYASQEPWLFMGSVKENILFGQPFDRKRYKEVLHICALEFDLKQFPYGDRTIIGERGVTLSGGQRARINLARAVYKKADIYLLDDPLSAVDSHVGRHLFEDCISGFLRDKAVILVTHQLQFLASADTIILLSDNGTVVATGSYDELCASGLVFTEQLATIKATTEAISRQSSVTSQKSSISGADSLSALELKFPERKAEMRTVGKVKSSVYRNYFLAGESCSLALLVFSMCILAQLVTSTSDFWMSYWANTEDKRKLLSEEANVTVPEYSNLTSSEDLLETTTCIYIYTGLILSLIVLTLGSIMLFFLMCMKASINLHDKLFNSIIHARMNFFNSYPSGQILNRFSKDMGSIDEILPQTLSDVLQRGLILMGIIIVIGIANYWLLLVTSVMLVIFYLLRAYYVHTSRSLKRMEGITKSPAFSHLSASLQGLTTIRAFGAEAMMEKQFDEHQDVHSSVWYPSLVTNRAFGLCLDSICIVYIGIIALSFLLLGGQGGDVGLAVTQAIALIGMLQWGIRQSAEMENQMTSVERVLEYTSVEQEPPFDSAPGTAPPKEWPRDGAIIFNHVFLVYVKGESAVLKGVNFSIKPKEKIGIVGRTGAGKTSLITALFRLTELQSGRILIDSVDISKLGLHDLRSKISIIPQEAALFSGPLRENLDPFEQHSDAELWNVLEEVELKLAIEDLPGGLSHRVCEGGSNFSMGQRQLLCLARAILRNNKILVLDEATANVDPNTDELIQKTIRHKFADCTVLTIAHRLQTVMDSDRILVMDDGSIVEFDIPHVLLNNTHGFLFKMVQETGSSMAEALQKMAQNTYKGV